MKVKIIEMDLDDTIFRRDQTFSKSTIETIKKLNGYGYIVIINSGRPARHIYNIVNKFGFINELSFLIGCNGAEILNCKTNEFIQNVYLEINTIKDIYNLYKNEEMAICLYDDSKVLSNKETQALKDRCKHIEQEYEIINYEEINKVYSKVLGIIDWSKHDYFRKLIEKNKSEYFDSFFSVDNLIEFVPKDLSKAKGIKKVCGMLGVEMSEVLSFGDHENDYEMLKETIGVAMGENNIYLKDVAKYFTKTCQEDGFSYFIENNVLNNNS